MYLTEKRLKIAEKDGETTVAGVVAVESAKISLKLNNSHAVFTFAEDAKAVGFYILVTF